jgi:hypothetical protein
MRWPPGILLGLDLGSRTGVAIGRSDDVPRCWSVEFGADFDEHGRLFHALGSWLRIALRDWGIDGVAFEATLPFPAYRKLGTSEAAVLVAHGMRAIVEEACYGAGIRCEALPVISIRKHFIGMASAGSREATKLAVVRRARSLGFIGPRNHDDDAADAAACWDLAAHTLMARQPKVLAMWGGG